MRFGFLFGSPSLPAMLALQFRLSSRVALKSHRRPPRPLQRSISQLTPQYPTIRDDIVPLPVKVDFTEEIAKLRDYIGSRRNLVAITGAGLSTESGLPDYRSPNGSYSKGHRPVTIQEFGASEKARQRFWARSFEGWMKFSNASPNRGHFALQLLQSKEKLSTIITQNVDGLHQKAGSHRVVELHGSLHKVKCMDCGTEHDRIQFQTNLAQLNPEWYRGLLERHERREKLGSLDRADGDVDLEMNFETFRVPPCPTCGGRLQPGVVMFGDNVPAAVTKKAKEAVEQADGLLVAGTSLQVFSAYKWVLQARERGVPVVIINIGPTRADHEAYMKIESRLGDILPAL